MPLIRQDDHKGSFSNASTNTTSSQTNTMMQLFQIFRQNTWFLKNNRFFVWGFTLHNQYYQIIIKSVHKKQFYFNHASHLKQKVSLIKHFFNINTFKKLNQKIYTMKNSNKNCFQFIDTFKIIIYQRKVSSMYKIYQGNYSMEKGFIYFYLNSKFLHSFPLFQQLATPSFAI